MKKSIKEDTVPYYYQNLIDNLIAATNDAGATFEEVDKFLKSIEKESKKLRKIAEEKHKKANRVWFYIDNLPITDKKLIKKRSLLLKRYGDKLDKMGANKFVFPAEFDFYIKD